MIEVREMRDSDNVDLLERVQFGHLGMAQENDPYVVPIHFAYVEPDIYIYTTEGLKWEIIQENPKVCLNVNEIIDNRDWKSVIVRGEAVRLTNAEEIKVARERLVKVNPTLTPAVSIQWMDHWVRENVEVILKLTPTLITGRRSVKGSDTRTPFVPTKKELGPL